MHKASIISNPTLEACYHHFRHRFQLTDRELEILKIITAHGLTNKEIAERLDISEKTIKNHVASIQTKTNTHSTRKLQALIFRDTLLPVLLGVFQPTENIERSKQHATVSDQPIHQVG